MTDFGTELSVFEYENCNFPSEILLLTLELTKTGLLCMTDNFISGWVRLIEDFMLINEAKFIFRFLTKNIIHNVS